MKILVFTEGTIIIPNSSQGMSREEMVEQSRQEGIQREEDSLQYESKNEVPVEPNSVHDYANYAPLGNAVEKLKKWQDQGVTIYYLSSRRIKPEVEAVKSILSKYEFPDADNLVFRQQGEEYKDIAERLMPDILIEDDCESIGGEQEMTFTRIREDLKPNIKHILIKEFAGIDYLPNNIENLKKV